MITSSGGPSSFSAQRLMRRVSRNHACPVCLKVDWCLVAEDRSAAICQRIEEGAKKRCGDAGWLHVLKESNSFCPRPRSRRLSILRNPSSCWSEMARMGAKKTTAVQIETLAECLGVATDTLVALGAFWSASQGAWGFPMRDHQGRVTGIRYRAASGRKWSAKGCREGLFLPQPMRNDAPILIPEGPTTTAACLSLGMSAVGRPSTRSGEAATSYLKRLLRGLDVVVVGENDKKPDGRWPGREGATHTVKTLLPFCKSVRSLLPPPDEKDLRDWLISGLTRHDLELVIEMAPVHSLRIVTKLASPGRSS